MAIQCNELNQVYSELTTAFQDCNKIKNSDLRKMLYLIMAINVCNNGGVIPELGWSDEEIWDDEKIWID